MTPFFISRFILLRFIRFIGIDSVFYTLFNNLFTNIPYLIRNVGFIPVSLGLLQLYRFARAGLNISNFPNLDLAKLNPIVLKVLMETIIPGWDKSMKINLRLFQTLFKIFFGLISFSLFKPLIKIIFKYFFGLLTASVGIALNETLSGIYYLKWISNYILSWTTLFFPIEWSIFLSSLKENFSLLNSNEISRNSSSSSSSYIVPKSSIDNLNDSGSFLSIIGLIILGAGVILAVIITGDYIAPSTIRWVPGMETFLDQLYSAGNYILSWFKSSPPTPKTPTDNTPNIDIPLPDILSRSSSDSSTITPPTPLPSRPGTPIVLPHDVDTSSYPSGVSNWD